MVPGWPAPASAALRPCPRWLLFALELAALLLLASCYTFGDETSWVRIQNMGQEDASFSIEFLSEDGELLGEHVCPSRECPALAPGAGLTIPFQGVSSFPEEVLGSAVVTSDQPLIVLMVSDVERDEGRFQSAGDTLSTASSGGHLYLPFMVRRSGPEEDWNGRFVVQNVSDDVAACATLVYIDESGEVAWDPYDPARPPPERSPDCPDGGLAIPPGASVFRDPVSLAAPPPFRGAVRVDLHTNSAGIPGAAQSVVATAGLWNDDSLHFGSYRALTENELGRTVLLPLVERDADGSWSTEFQVENRDPRRPATVTLRIEGLDYSIDPPEPVVRESMVTVRGSELCVQDDPRADCLDAGEELPEGFRGYALLSSDEPLAVTVSRTASEEDAMGIYRGVALQEAATRLYLPLVVKNAEAPDRTGERSLIRVQVADGGDASVTLRYLEDGVSGSGVEQQIEVSGAATIIPDESPLLADGFAGSAVLESDRPIVAVVELTTGGFTGDTLVMYTAVPGS